jgi:hypothetical protein
MTGSASPKRTVFRVGKPQSFTSSCERGHRRLDILELLPIVESLKGDASVIFAEVLARRK